MTYLEKLGTINGARRSMWSERICSEISYLDSLAKYDDRVDTALLTKAVDMLYDNLAAEGNITNSAAENAEKLLLPFADVAKDYKEYFISHAHIDMNWMWGYNETVNVTIDTFRTILELMREYPEMTYAQSQASTYEIIEKFRPDMLDEIRQRVHEGRWEVTAAEWVEPDKNMPDGESLVRQILQAKKYLSKLLDIPASSLNIDFVPDTFGHNANVPEILADAGIKYMYHCRGYDGPCLYKFVAPSGKKTVNYCEYQWYGGDDTTSTQKFEILPDFCFKHNIKSYLVVFGVGDHGGGPSRRDIERIMRYKTWPLTPDISFGTFRQFFADIDKISDTLPEVNHELNYLFTGCYTTQTRIKMANRLGEARINDAEALSAMNAIFNGRKSDNSVLDRAWRNILFNHFHDIIPGSGTVETREFAMGRFQEAMGYITANAGRSMNEIASQIDTSGIDYDMAEDTRSEGAGVGYFQSQDTHFTFPSAERGRGRTRVYTLFNTTGFDRDENAEITVWDYNYGFDNTSVTDGEGNPLEYMVTAQGNGYWGHSYSKLLVRVKIKAMGYTTVILSKTHPDGHITNYGGIMEHLQPYINNDPVVLQNAYIKAVFDRKTMMLTSLVSKETGETLIDRPSCCFTLAHENPMFGMTAWVVGPTMSDTVLNEKYDARLTGYAIYPLYSTFVYYINFGDSRIDCTVTLHKDSRLLNFDIRVDWNEKAVHGEYMPLLRFSMPVSYSVNGKVVTDIPFGKLTRDAKTFDIPCLSYMQVCGDANNKLSLLADTKYGYRLEDDRATVSLVRSSYDPDPYPDRGIHNIRLAVAVCGEEDIDRLSKGFNHPVSFVSTAYHAGTLPLSAQAVKLEGDAMLSALKPAEDGEGVTLRIYSQKDSDENITAEVYGRNEIEYANSDAVEISKSSYIKANKLSVNLAKYSVETAEIKL